LRHGIYSIGRGQELEEAQFSITVFQPIRQAAEMTLRDTCAYQTVTLVSGSQLLCC